MYQKLHRQAKDGDTAPKKIMKQSSHTSPFLESIEEINQAHVLESSKTAYPPKTKPIENLP